jgi:hypothetical protein
MEEGKEEKDRETDRIRISEQQALLGSVVNVNLDMEDSIKDYDLPEHSKVKPNKRLGATLEVDNHNLLSRQGMQKTQ